MSTPVSNSNDLVELLTDHLDRDSRVTWTENLSSATGTDGVFNVRFHVNGKPTQFQVRVMKTEG